MTGLSVAIGGALIVWSGGERALSINSGAYHDPGCQLINAKRTLFHTGDLQLMFNCRL